MNSSICSSAGACTLGWSGWCGGRRQAKAPSTRKQYGQTGAAGSVAFAILSAYAPRGQGHRSKPLRAVCVAAATSSKTVHRGKSEVPDAAVFARRPKSLLEAQDDVRALQARLKTGGKRGVTGGECNKALRVLCDAGERWRDVLQAYNDLREAGVQIDLGCYRVLLDAAIVAKQGLDVVDLLKHSEAAHGPAPMHLYCSLISRLLKQQGRGTPAKQAAYGVWRALRATNYKLDEAAFRTGMNLCVELGRLGEARRLMDAMRAAGYRPGWGAYHILMKYHSQRGDMDGARKLFGELRAYQGDEPLGISAYNTLLAGFVRVGDLTMARAVLDKARREGAAPDVVTYSCFTAGLVAARRLDEAEGVLEEMAREGVEPGPHAYGALLDGCARANDWGRAERLLSQMRAAGLRPNLAHYNMLIRGRCYSASYGAFSAPALLASPAASALPAGPAFDDTTIHHGGSSLNSNGLSGNGLNGSTANGVSYSANGVAAAVAASPAVSISGGVGGLSCSSSLGAGVGVGGEHVDSLMAEMRASGLRPDAVTYGTLIHAAVRSGSIDAALGVLSAMRLEGVAPDAAVFTSLMKLFRAQGMQSQSLEFFQQLSASRSSAVDGWALSCLVAVHASSGNMEEAEGAVRRANELAVEQGRPPPVEAAYALLQGYGQQRDLRPALLAFRRFLGSGGRPHRKMCEYTYRLCLAAFDFQAAGQVLRAMRLMRGLELREELYRQQWQEAERRMQARQRGTGGNDSNSLTEKWKWWFGLPNRYYDSEWRQ